jgi:hypothetical protein
LGKRTGKPRGRPPGSKTRKEILALPAPDRERVKGNARVHAQVLPKIKLMPLEVMLANMEWAWDKAARMLRDITRDPELSGEAKLEAYKELQALRDRVQRYAEAAAPYCHPRLNAVAAVTEQGEVVEIDPLREHIKEFAEHFRIVLEVEPKGETA